MVKYRSHHHHHHHHHYHQQQHHQQLRSGSIISGTFAAALSVNVLSLSSLPAIRSKRRMFFINVFGVTSTHDYTIVKVTQDTTTQEVVQQSLQKANKSDARPDDYVLMEEVHKGWEKKEKDAGSQRILDLNEKVLLAQNKWKGSGKFILRRKCEDPSTRAWMTTMVKEQKRRNNSSVSDIGPEWDSAQQTFLVCIYNVAPDQPYTILEAPVSSTAQDLITQAMLKARRQDNPSNFVLIEESVTASVSSTESERGHGPAALARSAFRGAAGGSTKHTTRTRRRALSDEENVYKVQSAWRSEAGKLMLTPRSQAPAPAGTLASSSSSPAFVTSPPLACSSQQQEQKDKQGKRRSGLQRWNLMRFTGLNKQQKDREKTDAIVDGGAVSFYIADDDAHGPTYRNNTTQQQQQQQQQQRMKHFPTLQSLDEGVGLTADDVVDTSPSPGHGHGHGGSAPQVNSQHSSSTTAHQMSSKTKQQIYRNTSPRHQTQQQQQQQQNHHPHQPHRSPQPRHQNQNGDSQGAGTMTTTTITSSSGSKFEKVIQRTAEPSPNNKKSPARRRQQVIPVIIT